LSWPHSWEGWRWETIFWGGGRTRSKTGSKFYGWLEIGIGIYCALSLQIIHWGSELYVTIARASFPPGPLTHLLRLFLAGIALLVPTALMGGTLPVLARLWVRSIQTTASGVATFIP